MLPTGSLIQPVTTLGGKPVEAVSTTTVDGVNVCGWLIRNSNQRVVIVFAGYGGNRSTNLGLAEFYLSRGWSVLLPDLRATGESGGDQVGFGYLERRDVRAWVEFAKNSGLTEIGLHGQSLGAAAIVYSLAESPCDFSFIVLDSCYDDLRNALYHRLSWLPVPSLTLKPVEWFGSAALGTPIDRLRPLDTIKFVSCPVLFVAGDQDSRVLPSETLLLFAACPEARKKLCWMPGGRHENLWIRFSDEYASAIDAILK
ncbi:MAG: alpha/beta hydrolase [Planctomycetota bacterium]